MVAIGGIGKTNISQLAVVAVSDNSENHQSEIRDLADCYITDFEHIEEFWKFASAK